VRSPGRSSKRAASPFLPPGNDISWARIRVDLKLSVKAFDVGFGFTVTLYRVMYEYADPDGGGIGTDYFRTGSRYTLPTTAGVGRALANEDITLIGFETIERFSSAAPGDETSEEVPEDSDGGKIFELADDAGADRYFVEARGLKGPQIMGEKVKMPARESAALLKSWRKWLPHFIKQETADPDRSGDAVERAFILATIRACQDVYKRVPGEEEMARGESELARKLNLFYLQAREKYLHEIQ